MAALYKAHISSEKVYGTKLYSVYFFSYSSEEGNQAEGFIHGMVSEKEAQEMKMFWETGGAKMAMRFMHVTPGPDYTPEEWVEIEREMLPIEHQEGMGV
jgi:hypothetical protein